MSIEIERKFLVKNNSYKKESYKHLNIKQGFLNSNKNRVVRIRIIDNRGFITIKGISSDNGLSRYEWEKEITINDAQDLLSICEKGVIEKNRYLVKCSNHIFEVDEFIGENDGLIIAEVELKSEDEKFCKPKWLSKEVTGIAKYYNSELSKKPFKEWV